MLGVSRSYFERDVRPHIREEQIRRAGPGRPLLFHGRAVLEAWAARRLAHAGAGGETPTDPLLAGATSPALEEYRRERAILARLERLEREGDLLPRDATHNMLGRIAALLRDAGLTLQRQFGAEAHAILAEALDGAEREIAAHFGQMEKGENDTER